MTHLYIELNTGLTEEVNSSIISKLYELAISGDLDNTSDLKGRLHSNVGYRYQIEYLNNTYGPDLHIDASNYAIPFEDPNMLLYLLSLGIGTNGAITEAQAAAVTDTVANSQNTTVTKFNELRYFTNITESKTGFSGNRSGKIRFYGWTALEEVDISNFTSIGHDNGASWEDTFIGCTSLKKVTASDKLTKLGNNAFSGCSNLDTFTGLDGVIEVWNNAFYNCSKLPQSFFQPLSFVLKLTGNNEANIFSGCTLLTSINIAQGTTYIPVKCFYGCSNLTTVTLPSGITDIRKEAFRGCTSLTSMNINFSLITSIGDSSFYGAPLVINSLNIPNLTSLGNNAFNKTNVITITDLGSITTLQTQTFRDVTTLTSVTLPNTITEIKNHCFYGCSNLATINLPTSCTTLHNNCFELCTNLDVTLDLSNVTSIGVLAFLNCNKLNISNFPKAATYSNYAFYKMYALTSVTIPKEVVTIGNGCFAECNNIQTLTFELNSQIETINAQAFKKCTSLKTLIIPEGCTTIGQEAFGEMGLTLLDIPSTVTNIGSIAFRLAALNATIIFRCNVPTFDSTSDIFAFTPTQLNNVTVKIYVPDDLVTAYQTVPCLSNYTNSIFGISQLPNS